MKTNALSLFLSLALVSGAAMAQTTVSEAWARGTTPAQKASGLFMQLRSADAARLVSGSTPLAERVEIHEMAMVGDVMQMRQLQALELPAGKTVELKPGGYHIMLMGLKQQLKDGETVPLTLKVERAGKPVETLELKAPVRALGAAKPAHSAMH